MYFLNVPLLGNNRTYQIFAHHSCVLPLLLMTMCPYPERVQYIENYGASVGDYLDAKVNEFKHIK